NWAILWLRDRERQQKGMCIVNASRFVLSVISITVCVVAIASSSAFAELVQVRDEAGGEDPFGSSTGYFETGLSSIINGTTNGGPYQSLGVGAYALEMDFGSGFTP